VWARVYVLRTRTRRDALGEQRAKNPGISQDILGLCVISWDPPGISRDIVSKPHETAVCGGSGLETQENRKTHPFRKSGSISPTLLLTHSRGSGGNGSRVSERSRIWLGLTAARRMGSRLGRRGAATGATAPAGQVREGSQVRGLDGGGIGCGGANGAGLAAGWGGGVE